VRLTRARGATAAFRRLHRAAGRLARAAWPAARPKAAPPPRPTVARMSFPPGCTSPVPEFGSNPGRLDLFVHVPRRTPAPGAPLIVVLHGCGQEAPGFAADAGWVAVSEALGVPLLLPAQTRANNRHGCFHWFRPGDVTRGKGEAMSIRQALRWAMRHFATDRRRVFVVGLSAGGAMAAALLAIYPAVFRAGAVVAGMPVGAAVTAGGALLRMRSAAPFTTRAGLAASVRAHNPTRAAAAWPLLSLWQGGRDRTVDPANAELLAAQWGALHGLDAMPASDAMIGPGVRRRSWGPAGRALVELWTIEEMEHGFPIGAAEGRPAPWVLPMGVPAAREICAFWGLEE